MDQAHTVLSVLIFLTGFISMVYSFVQYGRGNVPKAIFFLLISISSDISLLAMK